MKKTLIALLACSSLAWAGLTPDEAQQRLQEQLDMYSSFDQGFQFSFGVESTAQLRNTYYFLTLDDNFTLATQQGLYVGFADQPETPRNTSNINAWAASQGTSVVDVENKAITLTKEGPYSMVWFSYGLNAQQQAQTSQTSLTAAEFVITVKDGNTTVSMTRADGVVDNLVMTGYELDPKKISFNFGIVATDKPEQVPAILYRPDFKLAPVPEPATGALSLLALAGLAARRRRK